MTNSIIGCGAVIEKGAVVKDSIIMENAVIREGAVLDKAIVAENAEIGARSQIGTGEEAPNKLKPAVYAFGLAVIAENTVIPPDVKVGKNTAVAGVTVREDYPGGILASGETLDKAGDLS